MDTTRFPLISSPISQENSRCSLSDKNLAASSFQSNISYSTESVREINDPINLSPSYGVKIGPHLGSMPKTDSQYLCHPNFSMCNDQNGGSSRVDPFWVLHSSVYDYDALEASEIQSRSQNPIFQQENFEFISLPHAVFHLFKSNVGVGIFLLPTYYNDTGFLLGLVSAVGIGYILGDSVVAVVKAKMAIADASVFTYPQVVKVILGRWPQRITKISLVVSQSGFCILYLQYVVSIASQYGKTQFVPVIALILSVIVVTYLSFFTHRLQLLGYISLIAGICMAGCLIATFSLTIQQLRVVGIAPGTTPFRFSHLIFLFLSGHTMAMEGIAAVLPVENCIKQKEKLRYVSLIKHFFFGIIVLYVSFGLVAYLTFGSSLTASIMTALPPGTLRVALEIILAISLLLTYPIQLVPALQLLDRVKFISKSKPRKVFIRLVLGFCFGFITLCIGGGKLAFFGSLLGALIAVPLGIFIPSALSLVESSALAYRGNSSFSPIKCLIQKAIAPQNATEIKWVAYIYFSIMIWVSGIYFTIMGTL